MLVDSILYHFKLSMYPWFSIMKKLENKTRVSSDESLVNIGGRIENFKKEYSKRSSVKKSKDNVFIFKVKFFI